MESGRIFFSGSDLASGTDGTVGSKQTRASLIAGEIFADFVAGDEGMRLVAQNAKPGLVIFVHA